MFKKFANVLKTIFIREPEIIAPTKIVFPKEEDFLFAGGFRISKTSHLIGQLVLRDMVCWKISNDLSETIEKEWWN